MKTRLTVILVLLFFLSDTLRGEVFAWRKKVDVNGLGNPLTYNPLNTNTVYSSGPYGSSGEISVSYDRGKTWQLYSSVPGGGLIQSILVNPNDSLTLMVGQDAQPSDRVMKTTNGGVSWFQTLTGKFSDFGVPLEFNPAHPDTVFTMMGSTIYRSTDFGDTWSVVNVQTWFNAWCDAALSPLDASVMYVGDALTGIWKTTNGGVTFRRVYATSGEIPMIAIDQENPAILYATKYYGGGGFLKSTNYGDTWLEIPGFSGVDCWGVTVALEDNDFIVMGTYTLDTSKAGIYISRDKGSTWTRLTRGLPLGSANYGLLALDSTTVIALQDDGVYKLESTRTIVEGTVIDSIFREPVTNGVAQIIGSNEITDLSRTGGYFSFAHFEEDPTILNVQAYPYFHQDAQLQFVLDSTVWQNISLSRLPVSFISGSVSDSATQLPVHANLRLSVETSVGKKEWTTSTDANGQFSFDSLYISYQNIVLLYQLEVDPDIPFSQRTVPNLYLSTAGISISIDLKQADVFVVGEDSLNFGSYYQSALNAIGLQAYIWNTILKGPAPFQQANRFRKNIVIYFTGTKHTPLMQVELDSFAVALNNSTNLFITGQDFVEKNDSSDLLANYLGISYGGIGYAYTRGFSGDLFAGFAFVTAGTSANNQDSRDIIAIQNPGARPILGYYVRNVLIGTAAIRIDSVGSGSRLILMGFGFEAIHTDTMRRAVMQRVIGYLDGSIVVGVDNDKPNSPIPVDFVLKQNYPNPFNPTTTIGFSIPQFSFVTLKVYNLLGQELVTLVNEQKSPGNYKVEWNANGLPSGMYFYRLTTKDFTQTKKMLLLK